MRANEIMVSPLIEMVHGHSSLVRLIEELTSHAELLAEGPEEPAIILEELNRFANGAAAEFETHIRDEESTLFLQLRDPDALAQLLADHRELEGMFAAILELIGVPGAAEVPSPKLIESLRALNELFSEHDQRERQAFGVLERESE